MKLAKGDVPADRRETAPMMTARTAHPAPNAPSDRPRFGTAEQLLGYPWPSPG
ncbi:hypothetical protein [Chelativorans sp. Marseille-P2723]|uniref:hypothetical protein n=1 Tax=Chelativorans sp. Marseille-P2723 TaxID=2709133 RepID=UPI001570F0B4|nr:hypothetical protein [Chelativorans sp. Marseille-P2723]